MSRRESWSGHSARTTRVSGRAPQRWSRSRLPCRRMILRLPIDGHRDPVILEQPVREFISILRDTRLRLKEMTNDR